MEVKIENLIGWNVALKDARTTVGKKDIKKEPSNHFKKNIIVNEHSPIRMLVYEIYITNIPYYVAMHLRTHHIGFKAAEDDIYFIQTSRSDRTQKDRDKISQTAPVDCRIIANAQSIINTSRVRLCSLADKGTLKAWRAVIRAISNVEPLLARVCQPNCIYRGFCPENKECCGFVETLRYANLLNKYRSFCKNNLSTKKHKFKS